MFSSANTSASPTSSHAHSPLYVLPANPFRRDSRDSARRFSLSRSSIASSAFWRRKSSSTSSASLSVSTPLTTPSTSPPAVCGASSYLNSAASTITCSRCHADLALTSQIISKGFTGRHGRAYLLSSADESPNIVPSPHTRSHHPNHWTGGQGDGSEEEQALPNTTLHRAVPRHLVTGMHTVCDVSCAQCGNVLGWKYVNAEEASQRYKVGKFILESKRTRIHSHWDGAGGLTQQDERRLNGDFDGDDDSFDYGLEGWPATDKPSRRSHSNDDEDIVFDSQDEDECEDLFAGVWSPALARARRADRENLI